MHEIRAVIHGDGWPVMNRGFDMLVVAVVVLALDGIDANTKVAHKRSGHIILG